MVASRVRMAAVVALVALVWVSAATASEVTPRDLTAADPAGFVMPKRLAGSTRVARPTVLNAEAVEDLLSQKIVKGEGVHSIDQAPYVVHVQVKLSPTGDNPYGLCTGVLVARDVVFTAAHCFGTPTSPTVTTTDILVCGGFIHVNKLWSSGKIGDHCVFGVQDFRIHPKYVDLAKGYDVAAIKLGKPLAGAKIATVSFNTAAIPKYPKALEGYVRGWGVINAKATKHTKVLRELKVWIYRPTNASEGSDASPWSYFLRGIAEEGVGFSCHGDSGGPLVVQPWRKTPVNFRRHVVVGVTSWFFGDEKGRCSGYMYFSRWSHPSHAKFLKKTVAIWGRKLRTV